MRHLHPLAFALLLGCLVLPACDKSQGGVPAAASAAAQPVITLSAADVLTLAATPLASGPVVSGSLQPKRSADVRAEASGVVLEVLKENGQPVKAGDLLLRMNSSALRDSSLAAAEAVRVGQQNVAQAERLLQRQQMLAKEGMVSQAALEDAQLRRISAAGDLSSAQARAAQARDLVSKTLVRAPFAGIVSGRAVSAGDTATMGMALMKVIDPGSLRFEGQVNADSAAGLRVGLPVSFRIAGEPGRWYDGRISRLDAMANPTTRQVAVIIDFAHPEEAPRVAGLLAEGVINSQGKETLMLPAASVVRAGDSAYIWRVAKGKLERAKVSLGERDARSGDYPVTAGAAPGDVILRIASSTLTAGQPVRMAAVPSASAVAAAAASAATR